MHILICYITILDLPLKSCSDFLNNYLQISLKLYDELFSLESKYDCETKFDLCPELPVIKFNLI